MSDVENTTTTAQLRKLLEENRLEIAMNTDYKALSGDASMKFHTIVESACKLLGINKSTFIRLAVRILVIRVAKEGLDILDSEDIKNNLIYTRSAFDMHKDL